MNHYRTSKTNVMLEDVPIGGYTRRDVVELQKMVRESVRELPKFELKKEKRQMQQAALDYWAFHLEKFLAKDPQASEEASKQVCLMTLGEVASDSIPQTAKSLKDIKKVLQTHVNKLEKENFHAIIKNMAPGKSIDYYIEQLETIKFYIRIWSAESHDDLTNLLVDTVLKKMKHLPQFICIFFHVPHITDIDAPSRFIALRNGLQKMKRAYVDITP